MLVPQFHLSPAMVILQTVDGQGDHFHVAFAELTAQSGSSAQLRGAHRGVIAGVGEQNSPSRMKRTSEAASLTRGPSLQQCAVSV